jgi:hypothetical protein
MAKGDLVTKFLEQIARDVLGVPTETFARVYRLAEARNDVPDWTEATDAEIRQWWERVS